MGGKRTLAEFMQWQFVVFSTAALGKTRTKPANPEGKHPG